MFYNRRAEIKLAFEATKFEKRDDGRIEVCYNDDDNVDFVGLQLFAQPFLSLLSFYTGFHTHIFSFLSIIGIFFVGGREKKRNGGKEKEYVT